MKIRPYFRWFDLWVGVYVDAPNRAVYLGLLPMIGLKFSEFRRTKVQAVKVFLDFVEHENRVASLSEEELAAEVLKLWGETKLDSWENAVLGRAIELLEGR